MPFDYRLFAQKREEQRYSQRELAKAAGVDASWLGSVETGRSQAPDYVKVRACARVLGVDPDVFFADPTDSFQQIPITPAVQEAPHVA